MKINEAFDMKGRLTLRLQNRQGKLVREMAADNDIVMTGRDLVAKLFAGVKIPPISHIAVGTGITAVDPDGDKKLQSELHRKEITTIDSAKDITQVGNKMRVVVSTELDFVEGNGALTEAAMFNSDGADPSIDVMYNRVVFPPVNKTSDFKLTLVWEILF
jgi:hypothetical protein